MIGGIIMKYVQENTIGKPLQCHFRPHQRLVNNGWVIETQSEDLLWQLIQNENDHSKETIDWFLFKEGESVLIDNHGRKFACMKKSHGYIQLAELKYDLFILARNDDGIRLQFVFPTSEDFIRSMNKDDDCMADHEILYVEWKDKVIYSSLYKKAKSYDETLRTMDLYEWFKCELN